MKTVFATFIFLAFSLTTASAHADEYRYCRAYTAINKKLGCDNNNYLVRFGRKYCEAYVRHAASFSPRTQEILQSIRRCLVFDALRNKKLTCANSEESAMTSHLRCYIRSGFCEIPISEQFEIWWVAKSETVQPSFLKTMYRVRAACGF